MNGIAVRQLRHEITKIIRQPDLSELTKDELIEIYNEVEIDEDQYNRATRLIKEYNYKLYCLQQWSAAKTGVKFFAFGLMMRFTGYLVHNYSNDLSAILNAIAIPVCMTGLTYLIPSD